MPFTPVLIVHQFDLPDGGGAFGRVDFEPVEEMKNGGESKSGVQRAVLASGALGQVIMATTDPGTSPPGVPYRIVVRLTGQPPRTYYARVPHDAGDTIALVDLLDWATGPLAGGSGGSGTPAAGSVTDASVSDTAGIALAKTADSTAGGGRLAMTSAERAKLAGVAAGATVYTTGNAQTDLRALLAAGANVTLTPNSDGTITVSAATTGASGIPGAILDVKGDLIAATANDTPARLPAGTAGQVLTVTPAAATGLAWASPAGGTPSDGSVTDAKVATGAGISLDKTADSATRVAMTAAERTKLGGVASGATANSPDSTLLSRGAHTGTQAISTVAGLQAALDAKAALLVAFATKTSAYTLAAADVGTELGYSSTVAGAFTVPTDTTVAIPVGATVRLAQLGTGQLSIAAASGVTLNSRGGALKLAGQHAQAELVKTGANAWRLYGDITT